jgi:hypothetical protein
LLVHGGAGALAALEERACRFEDETNRFEEDDAFASLFDGF